TLSRGIDEVRHVSCRRPIDAVGNGYSRQNSLEGVLRAKSVKGAAPRSGVVRHGATIERTVGVAARVVHPNRGVGEDIAEIVQGPALLEQRKAPFHCNQPTSARTRDHARSDGPNVEPLYGG